MGYVRATLRGTRILGIENLSLIPSSVGASPIQNIGAYGTEVSETITRVKTVDLKSGDLKSFSNEECRFGYRDSIFKHQAGQVIASVAFRLSKSFEYKEKYIDLSRELNGTRVPSLEQVRRRSFVYVPGSCPISGASQRGSFSKILS